ncbi:MAG: SpoIIE family protein phosphatase [Pseudomonadota bacterium]
MSHQSISRRFNHVLLGVVFVVVLGTAGTLLFLDHQEVKRAFAERVALTGDLAAKGLGTPVWNLDEAVATGIVDALVANPEVASATLRTDEGEMTSRVADRFHNHPTKFDEDRRFVTTTVEIRRDDASIGTLDVVWIRDEITSRLERSILAISALTALLLIAIAATSIFLTRYHISRPLVRLQRSAEAITDGDLDAAIDLDRTDEIGALAADFDVMRGSIRSLVGELRETNAELEDANATLESRVEERTAELAAANASINRLNAQLREENVRLGAELEVTRRLQEMLLPSPDELNAVDGLDIAGHMTPADEVGGDYYDVIQFDGRTKIGIGDVTGHGLESGMVMLMTQMGVRTLLNAGETDEVRFFDILNRSLYDNVQRMGTDKNLTLMLLDYDRGSVRLSGQHEDIIVVREGGELEIIDTVELGFPVGLDREIGHFVGKSELTLGRGDGLVLYTDGITEAEDVTGVQYGLERLTEVVRNHWQQRAESIKQAVLADVRAHIGDFTVYDDLTLLVLKQC